MVKYGNRFFSLYNLLFWLFNKAFTIGVAPPGAPAPVHTPTHAHTCVRKKIPAVDPSGDCYSNCSANHRSKSPGELPLQ